MERHKHPQALPSPNPYRGDWPTISTRQSGQWQQSMFPMGCMGWMMATTGVPSEAAVETSAMESIAMVAAMTRRRVRARCGNAGWMALPNDK